MSSEPRPPSGLYVVGAVCLAALTLPLSFSAAAVATPAIGRELGGDPTALTWITNAFMLTFGSLMMAAGALADRYGRKRMFTAGVGLFVIFSIAIGLADSILVVDLLRAAQGVGAAGALAAGSAAMAQEFEGRARTRAFSLLGTTFGIGLAFGPIVAGGLIQTFGWRSIFLTGAVIGGLALVFGVPRMRETRDPDASRLDWPGVASFTAALSLFTFGVIQAPAHGWTSLLVLGQLAGAAISLGLFAWVETRLERPMLDLTLLRYPRFLGAQILPVATGFCYVVLLILLPLRFIGVEGRGEVQGGMMMLALSAPMLVAPSLAVALTRWLSAGHVAAAGFVMAAGGALWLGAVEVGPGFATVGPMLVIGFGAGLPWGLMDGLAVGVAPKERAGMATGIFNTTKVASEGITLALAGALLAALTTSALQAGFAGQVEPGMISGAARRLAAGDLSGAASIAPNLGSAMLTRGYAVGFQHLTWILAAVTFGSAGIVVRFLGQAPERQKSEVKRPH